MEYSTLSEYDRACLVAKYNSLYKRETIDPDLLNRGHSPERMKYLRKSLGTTLNISCDIEFTKEFKEYPEYDHFNFIMVGHNAYTKSGIPPFPGSLSEQPAQFMEILELLYQLDMEREQDAMRKSQQEKNK